MAKAAGQGGIELQSPKLYCCLDAGCYAESLLRLLEDLEVTGLGAVLDLEHQGEGRADFLAEVTRMAGIAEVLGAPILQLCAGPVDELTAEGVLLSPGGSEGDPIDRWGGCCSTC